MESIAIACTGSARCRSRAELDTAWAMVRFILGQMSAASSSAQPGCGREISYSVCALPRMSPVSSNTTAFAAVVPTSMPSRLIAVASPGSALYSR